MASFIKDPDSILDYQFDWSLWLKTGDEISTSTWVVPAGITKNSDANTTTTTTVWLSGGTLHEKYNLVNRIVTAGGRTEERTFTIRIKQK